MVRAMRKEVLGIFFNVLAAVNLSQQVHGESIIYSKIKPWRSVFEDFAGYKFSNDNGFQGGVTRSTTMMNFLQLDEVPDQGAWENSETSERLSWENVMNSSRYFPTEFTHPNVIWNDETKGSQRRRGERAPDGSGAWDFAKQQIDVYSGWADPEDVTMLYSGEVLCVREVNKLLKDTDLLKQRRGLKRNKRSKITHLAALKHESQREQFRLKSSKRKVSPEDLAKNYWGPRTGLESAPMKKEDLHYSYHKVGLISYDDGQTFYPRNPIAPTGITGRGLLGKWGANHAADPLVTKKIDGDIYFNSLSSP